MRIALFQIKNLWAGWYSVGGYVETLTRMGHEVLECSFPSNQVTPQGLEEVRPGLPTIGQLDECDVVLIECHEYAQTWLRALYRLEQWKRLKTPVVARFNESMDRGDLFLPARLDELRDWATHLSFPAAQDAEQYGGQWLPFSSDIHLFNPAEPGTFARTPKKYDLAFIGQMYGPRKAYFDQLCQTLPKGVDFTCGNALVQDLGGWCVRESMDLLAKNYRQIKIFFCLPPLSRLIVQKIADVMACGTFVMYPRLPGTAAKNLEQFVDQKEIVYYDPGYMLENSNQIGYYLGHEDEREAIAAAGSRAVNERNTLEQMLSSLLTLARSGVTA